MFAYIIIYLDVIGHIFAKPVTKYLTLLKVMVSKRVVQFTHGGSCKM